MIPSAPTSKRRSKQLRVAVKGVGHRWSTPTHTKGNRDVLALVTEPYSTVTDAHERLRELHTVFEERADRRAVFLSVYERMTEAVAERIHRAEFEDPDWVSEYLVTFANLYREAVYNYEVGDFETLPRPWLLAFEAAKREDSLVVQDAALGVNAHINYDLALTLESVGITPNQSQKYVDHSSITDVIREVVDEAQDSLASRDAPGIAGADQSLGRLDEWLLVFSIDECRESAWRTAVAFRSRCSLRRRFAHWVNAKTSTGAAHLILSSKVSDRLHDTLATLEESASDDA